MSILRNTLKPPTPETDIGNTQKLPIPVFLSSAKYIKGMPKKLKKSLLIPTHFQTLYDKAEQKNSRKQRQERRVLSRRSRACQQLHSSTPEVCPNGRYILCQRRIDDKIIIQKFYIPCNAWKCPICSLRKKSKLYHAIKEATQKEKFFFLTCTIRENSKSLSENWKFINKSWNTLLNRLKRIQPNLKYFRVTELQKNGMPHIHAIINVWLPPGWSHSIWHQITHNSFKCEFEFIKISVASYIFKYFSKSIEDILIIRDETGKKTKIFNCSRNFLKLCTKIAKWTLLCFSEFENIIDEFALKYLESYPKWYERAGPLIKIFEEQKFDHAEFILSELFLSEEMQTQCILRYKKIPKPSLDQLFLLYPDCRMIW